MKRKNEKDHHKRKSQGSAEFFRKKRKAANEARGKQILCPIHGYVREPHVHDPGWTLPEPPGSTLKPSDT